MVGTTKRELPGFLEVEENHGGASSNATVRTDFKSSILESESEFRDSVPSHR